MVEPHDDFNTSDPTPDPLPEGNHGDLSFATHNPADVPKAPALPTHTAPHESASTRPDPAARMIDAVPGRPAFPMLLAAALVVGLVAAWLYFAKPWEARKLEAATPEAASKTAHEAEPFPEINALNEGVESLQADVEGLRDELKTLQDRVEAIPKPAPPPDLGPIQNKIADLAKDSETVADLPKKLGALDERVGTIDKKIADLQGAVDALKGEVKKSEEPAPASTPAEDVSVSDAAMSQAVDLFKAGKYKEANDAFRKLTESHPDDARVWYYAALSRGSATKEWTGETTRLVEKGVERERAGTPEASKIDTVFAQLNPSFKPWLDAYRKGAKPR